MDRLLSGGLQPVRTVLRALALRQLDTGQSTPAAAVSLGLSAKAVWQIGKRYQQGGLERALYDASRPGAAPALDGEQRQRIIAVACSSRRQDGHAGRRQQTRTWNRRMNRDRVTVQWKFTRKQARHKLRYIIKRSKH